MNDDLPPLPDQYDAAAHMYPWDIEDLQTGEKTGVVFSIPVGCSDGKSVPLWTSGQMRDYARAAVLAERELWDLLDKHGVCLSRNYIRDASGRFNGWMACGHGGAFMSKGETMRDAALACADAIRKGTP